METEINYKFLNVENINSNETKLLHLLIPFNTTKELDGVYKNINYNYTFNNTIINDKYIDVLFYQIKHDAIFDIKYIIENAKVKSVQLYKEFRAKENQILNLKYNIKEDGKIVEFLSLKNQLFYTLDVFHRYFVRFEIYDFKNILDINVKSQLNIVMLRNDIRAKIACGINGCSSYIEEYLKNLF